MYIYTYTYIYIYICVCIVCLCNETNQMLLKSVSKKGKVSQSVVRAENRAFVLGVVKNDKRFALWFDFDVLFFSSFLPPLWLQSFLFIIIFLIFPSRKISYFVLSVKIIILTIIFIKDKKIQVHIENIL